MRNALADEITALAARDERIVLLSGDIGNRLFDRYKSLFPGRFFNCGVAEANMIGVAAGLALSGLRPLAYAITPFATARCFEQIKLDVCCHRAPVTIVGVGAGLSYASLGPTHHAFEDIGLLRLLPGLSIVCPCDAWEVRSTLRAALQAEGPVYLRLGKKGEPLVYEAAPEFRMGEADVLRAGEDCCLLGVGNILPNVLASAELLEQAGVSACVANVRTVKPLDEDLLARLVSSTELLVTIEEHSVIGGLGGAVAEWLAQHGPIPKGLLRLGIPDRFLHETGGQPFAREQCGLSPEQIARRVQEALRR